MSEKVTTSEFDDFENALKSLRPEAHIQRDQVMYRAGQASASRRGWLWPASTVAMTTLAICLGVLLFNRPEPQAVERIVFVTVPAPTQVASVPIDAERPPEPPRDIAALPQPTPPGILTVGSIRDMRFDDWRWRPEHFPDAPSTPETSNSDPPTLMNLLNAWTNEQNGKQRIR